jgi:SAM-dependent methyltransferase
MTHVGRFFDKQAADYQRPGRNHGMRPFHVVTAGKIEAGIGGDVLCIGGVWARGTVPSGVKLVVADLSLAMLQGWRDQGLDAVQADARDLPFGDQSFDHVVLPLILHHVAGESVLEARTQVARVLAETHRVLRPRGVCWISEFCVSAAVYAAEQVLAPLTRRVLALGDIPLVVMHSAKFYHEALQAQRFVDIEVETIVPVGAHAWDPITPIIGVPWFKVPRVLYPVTPTLIRSVKCV